MEDAKPLLFSWLAVFWTRSQRLRTLAALPVEVELRDPPRTPVYQRIAAEAAGMQERGLTGARRIGRAPVIPCIMPRRGPRPARWGLGGGQGGFCCYVAVLAGVSVLVIVGVLVGLDSTYVDEVMLHVGMGILLLWLPAVFFVRRFGWSLVVAPVAVGLAVAASGSLFLSDERLAERERVMVRRAADLAVEAAQARALNERLAAQRVDRRRRQEADERAALDARRAWRTMPFVDEWGDVDGMGAVSAVEQPVNPTSFRYLTVEGRVFVSCTAVWLRFNRSPNLVGGETEDGYSRHRLQARFDGDNPMELAVTQQWGSEDLVVRSSEFRSRLAQGRQVEVVLPWYGENNVRFEWTLSGSADALAVMKC